MKPANVTSLMLAELKPTEKMLVWAEDERQFRRLQRKVSRLGKGKYSIHRPVLVANYAYITRRFHTNTKKNKQQ